MQSGIQNLTYGCCAFFIFAAEEHDQAGDAAGRVVERTPLSHSPRGLKRSQSGFATMQLTFENCGY